MNSIANIYKKFATFKLCSRLWIIVNHIKWELCMKPYEFVNEIYLHDSLLEYLSYDGINLTLDIDLCWWMQKAYQPNDDEIKNIKVVFSNVSSFKLDGKERVDSDTIFECSIVEDGYNGNCSLIKIIFGDDNDIKIMEFRSESVELFWN